MAKYEISRDQVSKIATALLTERREWVKVSCDLDDYKNISDREIVRIDECLQIFGFTALQLELPST